MAEVTVGSAIRQGAVTKDGQGEAVTGIVMMLLGANSRTVVEDVKARVAQIAQEPAGWRHAQGVLRPDRPRQADDQDGGDEPAGRRAPW